MGARTDARPYRFVHAVAAVHAGAASIACAADRAHRTRGFGAARLSQLAGPWTVDCPPYCCGGREGIFVPGALAASVLSRYVLLSDHVVPGLDRPERHRHGIARRGADAIGAIRPAGGLRPHGAHALGV